MSSTLNISKGSAWMPSSDIFGNVLRKVSSELYPNDVALRQEIDNALIGFSYFGVSESEVDQATFNDFVTAVCHVLETEIVDHTTLTPYEMLCFIELKTLLLSDPRTDERGDTVGTFVASDDTMLSIPSRFMDLFLEDMAVSCFGVREQYPQLAQTLLSARVLRGSGVFDLNTLSNTEFCTLFEAHNKLFRFYGDGLARISGSIKFFDEISKYIGDLNTRFESDPRAARCED